MPVSLGQPYVGLQEEARALASRAEPVAAEADSMSTVHPELHRLLRESGLSGVLVPSAYGGRFESVDPVAACVIRETLMATSGNLDALFALQGIGSFAISIAGSEEQRSRWLARVSSAEALAALALTEPDAGSDIRSATTEVTADGGRLVLSGQKSFISNASAAAFFTVFAREEDSFSLFLVPADASGVHVRASPEIIAPHVLGEVELKSVELSEADRIGDPGQGFALILATLGVFRASVAAAAVGLAQAALEEAVRHTSGREQFGRPLSRLGGVAERLADSWCEVEAARLLTYQAAEAAREDPRAALNMSSMAKLYASEMAGRVVDRSVQVMGRYGLIQGSKIERLYRIARPMRIYEGASEALRPGIARALVETVRERDAGGGLR
jgi:acyl-CoA dehydrogenase